MDEENMNDYSPAQWKVITTLREHPDWCIFYRTEGAFYQQPDGTRIPRHRAAVYALMKNGGLVQKDEEQDTWTLAPHLQVHPEEEYVALLKQAVEEIEEIEEDNRR